MNGIPFSRILCMIVLPVLLMQSCGSEPATFTLTLDHQDILPLLEHQEVAAIRMTPFKNQPNEMPLQIMKAVHVNDNFFFLNYEDNRMRVLRYDSEGGFLNYVGNIGNGPGEYTSAQDFAVDILGQKIYVLSHAGNIMEYEFNGRFLRSHAVRLSSASLGLDVEEGSFVIYEKDFSPDQDAQAFHGIKWINQLGETLHSYPLHQNTNWEPIMEQHFTQSNGQLYFRESFGNTLYRIEGGRAIPVIVFDLGRKSFKPEYHSRNLFGLYELMQESQFFIFTRALTDGHIIYASFLDNVNTTSYHLIHNRASNHTTKFSSMPEELFLSAPVIDHHGTIGFFIPGFQVAELMASESALFQGFEGEDIDEYLNYLVFFKTN